MLYRDYRQKEVEAVKEATVGGNADSVNDFLPVACNFGAFQDEIGYHVTSTRMLTDSLCTLSDGSSGIMCWTSCQSVTHLPCGEHVTNNSILMVKNLMRLTISYGYSGTNAACTDIATNEVVDGGHCSSLWGSSACQLTCPSLISVINRDNIGSSQRLEFCRGDGCDMYMGGFVSALMSRSGTLDCLVLYFEGWKLDSRLKFTGACVVVFFSGICVEFLTQYRRILFKKVSYKGC